MLVSFFEWVIYALRRYLTTRELRGFFFFFDIIKADAFIQVVNFLCGLQHRTCTARKKKRKWWNKFLCWLICLREVRDRIYYLCKQNGDPNMRVVWFIDVGRMWDLSNGETRTKKKKNKRKTGKTLCETDRKENRPCINPSHFQSEKWQPSQEKTWYLHTHVSGDVSGQPPGGLFYGKLTASGAWFSDSYLTRKTLRDTSDTLFSDAYYTYFFFFFLFPFLMNSFDMTCLPDFKLFFPPKHKNTYNIICTL